MMKNKVDEIWSDLETTFSSSAPFVMRSYPNVIFSGFYIAFASKEKRKSIAFHIQNDVFPDIKKWNNLKEIELFQFPDLNNNSKSYLLIQLSDNIHSDIFSVLCEDLIASISNLTSEAIIIKELLNRFEKWKSLFDQVSAHDLSPEEQQGLYGELFFLRKLLLNNANYQKAITSWVGVEKQIRDFQIENWSVEVKTTHGNNHQKIHVSNERQLDTTNIKNLFLFHLSLETKLHSGETLNDIIDSIILILTSELALLNQFKSKLLEAGYFNNHRINYETTGYFIRSELFYKIEGTFPRIEERDIRNGVGDVKYTIITSQCSDYIKTEEYVLQTIVSQ